MVKRRCTRAWTDFVAAFRPLAILHIGRPKIETPLPDSVQKMADFMHIIEQWRDPCGSASWKNR